MSETTGQGRVCVSSSDVSTQRKPIVIISLLGGTVNRRRLCHPRPSGSLRHLVLMTDLMFKTEAIDGLKINVGKRTFPGHDNMPRLTCRVEGRADSPLSHCAEIGCFPLISKEEAAFYA